MSIERTCAGSEFQTDGEETEKEGEVEVVDIDQDSLHPVMCVSVAVNTSFISYLMTAEDCSVLIVRYFYHYKFNC